MRKYLLLSSLLITIVTLHAQDLPRKGAFGVQMQANPEGLGIDVLKVFPNSTASGLDLQAGDIIKRVDKEVYHDVNELVKVIGTWNAGDPISVQVDRDRKLVLLNGLVMGKPLETSAHGEVIYGSVDFDGGQLRSILELPHGVENPPVLYFLPGIGCGSLDFYYNPGSTVKLLVEELVQQGIAVYRVEKPGMGDSRGTQPCEEMDFNYEVAALKSGLHTLQGLDGIDSDQIFLYGHSLGTVSAPLVAIGENIKGIIAWGGVSKSWFEYSLDILREQKLLVGQDYQKIEENFRELLPFYYDFYVNQKTPQELQADERYAKFAKNYFSGEMWFGIHHYSYFHTLNQVSTLIDYQEADCPVLCLAGEFDLHAINTRWASEISAAVNHAREGQGEHTVVPQTTHHYHTVPSMADYNQLRSNGELTGAYMEKHFNPQVPGLVSEWIRKIVGA